MYLIWWVHTSFPIVGRHSPRRQIAVANKRLYLPEMILKWSVRSLVSDLNSTFPLISQRRVMKGDKEYNSVHGIGAQADENTILTIADQITFPNHHSTLSERDYFLDQI